MKTGIIGFPQVGKTSLFSMLTGAEVQAGRREERVGVAIVPDQRLDQLAELFQPRKLTHATIELSETGALTPETLRDGSGIAGLRTADALAQVVRAFERMEPDPPSADVRRLEFDMIVSDLGQVEKRRERVAKDLKKQRSTALLEEAGILERMQQHLEGEQPLRTLPLTPPERKTTRGFQFLSQKPILYVINVSEAEAAELDTAVARHGLEEALAAPLTGAVAICAKIEAEIAGLPAEEAAGFLSGYGLAEPGVARLARAIYRLLGQISYFTAGEDECRAWTVAEGTAAVEAAGVIHTDLSKHFIRAEVIGWQELLELGSEAAARQQGKMRLEGKDYIVQDGDVMHIRHSG
ncbi:MAG: redox-regulated ATPase YchF [Terriglobales bacterium]